MGHRFDKLSKEEHRRIASAGGRAAHALGRAHEWNSDEAKAAGKKGGLKVASRPGHMSEIGRKGGQARVKNWRERNRAQGVIPESAEPLPANWPEPPDTIR